MKQGRGSFKSGAMLHTCMPYYISAHHGLECIQGSYHVDINDVVKNLPDVHINMYADDCMLYTTANNWNHVYARLQESLSHFDGWCMQNNMVLNVSKSKCLVIGSRQKLSRIDYKYNHKLDVRNISLEYVKKFLYLGIYLDCEMSLSPLISHVKKIVSTKISTLFKIRKYITTRCALSIYKQTILPLFFIMLAFYLFPVPKRIQNNALTMCYNVRLLDRLSLVDIHHEASLVSLEQRRKCQLLSLMYVYKNYHNVERVFARATCQGNRFHFITDTYQSGKYQKSPYFKGTVLWDLLPGDTILLPTLDEFKTRLKLFFSPFNELLS